MRVQEPLVSLHTDSCVAKLTSRCLEVTREDIGYPVVPALSSVVSNLKRPPSPSNSQSQHKPKKIRQDILNNSSSHDHHHAPISTLSFGNAITASPLTSNFNFIHIDSSCTYPFF